MIWYIESNDYNKAVEEIGEPTDDASLKELFSKIPTKSIVGYNPSITTVDHMFLFQMENLVKSGKYTLINLNSEG